MADKEETGVPAELAQSLEDGSLWARFCDELKAAGDIVMQQSAPQDMFNRAEGYRYLTRLLRAGLESQVESSNPHFPRFFQLSNETIKIGNDNPDNIYHNANLDGRLNYRITGNRGTVHYLSFGTKAGSYETTGTMEPSGQLDAADLITDSDGNFEIIVSSKPQTHNWLPMREDSQSVIVRQTFGDRGRERPATYSIECMNPQADCALQPLLFARQLIGSARFVQGTAAMFVDWMNMYGAHINELPSDDQERCQRAGGDAAIHYLQSYWSLASDEALLITAATIPKCKTWNFQLSNFWMESLDYRYHKISVNKRTAYYDEDGAVTIIVAHSNPGARYRNWLTTAGHEQGGMLWRWVEAEAHPPVQCKVVKFAEL